MKKLQNNFTTPEQSKRLLELGVPAYSADCFYPTDLQQNPIEDATPTIITYQLDTDEIEWDKVCVLPCWSVGRLIEIYLLCAELKKPQMIFIKEDVLMMDRMINELCRMAESERLDFSKLDEYGNKT